jgi:DNA-directed RNA polymerase subunit RPC12/RpoP
MWELHCLRCGHSWFPRQKADGTAPRPKVCPNCKSRVWDTPPDGRGRPRKKKEGEA